MDEEFIMSEAAVANTPVIDSEKVNALDNIVDILKTWPAERVSSVLKILQAFEADPHPVAALFSTASPRSDPG